MGYGPMNVAGAICFSPPFPYGRRLFGLEELAPFYLWVLSTCSGEDELLMEERMRGSSSKRSIGAALVRTSGGSESRRRQKSRGMTTIMRRDGTRLSGPSTCSILRVFCLYFRRSSNNSTKSCLTVSKGGFPDCPDFPR